MPYGYLEQTVNNAYGRTPSAAEIQKQREEEEKNQSVSHKIGKLFGTDNDNASDFKSIIHKINPFVDKESGAVKYKNVDYQSMLNSDSVSKPAKMFIEDATGLSQSSGNGNTSTDNTASDNSGGFSEGNTDINSGDLLKMDVTQMPKLSANQISSIIGKYFSKSTVITPNDAEGIFNAQQKTGMSALAILGIGALESGYGTSSIAKAKNNIWGWGATNSNPSGNAKSFSQMSEGASQFAANYMNTYYNKYGAKSIYDAGTGNNPAGKGYSYYGNGEIETSWATQVGAIMEKFYNSLGKGTGGSGKSTSSANTGTSSYTPSSSGAGGLVGAAQKFLGVPFVWGGTSPKGFDCSGLVQYVANQNGIKTHRVSKDQYKYDGTPVTSQSDLQPGDLLFFDTHGANDGNVSHVGIYAGNGKMIHAPHTGDVVKEVDFSGSSYYQKAFVGAKRL